MIKPKPCPVCGSENLWLESAFDFKARVICPKCGHCGPWALKLYEKAFEIWNNESSEALKAEHLLKDTT